MNYQPYLEMHFLISDQMLQAIQENKLYFITLAYTTFFVLVILHYLVLYSIARFVLYRLYRRVVVSNGNVKDLI